MKKIGFIGTGVIADAMVRGIVADGHRIFVSERNQQTAASLASEFDSVTVHANQEVLDSSDIVILCLMDSVARDVLPTLRFRDDQVMFSAMARFSNEELTSLSAPAVAGGTVIPFPFIAKGNSPLLTLPTSPNSQAVLQDIFGARNALFELKSDAAFSTMMALQAVVMPSLTRLAHAVEWAEGEGLDPVLAEGFLRQLVGGFMLSEPLDEPHVKAMAASLGTPGGLNATLDTFLADGGDEARLKAGFDTLRASLS